MLLALARARARLSGVAVGSGVSSGKWVCSSTALGRAPCYSSSTSNYQHQHQHQHMMATVSPFAKHLRTTFESCFSGTACFRALLSTNAQARCHSAPTRRSVPRPSFSLGVAFTVAGLWLVCGWFVAGLLQPTVDTEYPGTAVERLHACVARAKYVCAAVPLPCIVLWCGHLSIFSIFCRVHQVHVDS